MNQPASTPPSPANNLPHWRCHPLSTTATMTLLPPPSGPSLLSTLSVSHPTAGQALVLGNPMPSQTCQCNGNRNSNSHSNDNNAEANDSATMTAMGTTCPGCALQWWQWRQCWWGGGSATATVEEAATAAAKEADDGPSGWRL